MFLRYTIKNIKIVIFLFVCFLNFLLSLTYSYSNSININKTENYWINLNKQTLTKQIPFNITILKQKFYHNLVSTNIIWKYLFTEFKWNIDSFLNIELDKKNNIKKIRTKPIISLLNWFLYVESHINNFGGARTADWFFNLVPDNIFNYINNNVFNYNINLLEWIKKLELETYKESIQNRKTIFYCNIWKYVKNWSDIIYVFNWKDYSKKYENKYSWKRNRIWHKISMCKIINKFLLNDYYRRNLYYFLNAKTSYVGAVLPFQFMPNNLLYYLNLLNDKEINLSNIAFYYKMISVFLFWKDYISQIDQFNKHFKTGKDFYNCLKQVRYDKYCKYIRNQIYRYNHTNWYVQKVLSTAYNLKVIDDLGMFSTPVAKFYLTDYNNYYINFLPIKLFNWQTWIKNWLVQLGLETNNMIKINNKIYKPQKNDKFWIIFNSYNVDSFDCYYIPYSKLVYCENNQYSFTYSNLDKLNPNLKLVPIKFKDKFIREINSFSFYKKDKILSNQNIYKIKNLTPWIILWYVNINNNLNFWIINKYIHKKIYNNFVYDLLVNFRYYR